MKFPKKIMFCEGSMYEVSFEAVKQDWSETVKQFDDLTEEKQQELIDNYDEDQADIWYDEQWYGNEVMVFGKFLGVNQEVRDEFIKNSIYNDRDDWASSLEVE